MLIELRKLSINKALSEETTCYSAEVWIDGKLAFYASNRGHGGADDYRRAGRLTEADVDAWLKANRSPREYRGLKLEPGLEQEVAVLIDEAEAVKVIRCRTRSNVITIEGGQVFSYRLRGRTAAAVIASVRSARPAAEVVNGGDRQLLLKAARIILAADDASIRDD